jgi:hypothetical protein
MTETRDHVRRLDLPWRLIELTECGRPLADVGSWITRAALVARVKEDGIQRAAYSTCMTCLETARRWPSWDDSPTDCLMRELGYRGQSNPLMVAELRAVVLLIAAHRGEFDQTVADLQGAISLAERRAAKRRR